MDTQNKTTQIKKEAADLSSVIKSATPLTALQLNGFKLDVKHTVLTPQYLETLSKE